MEENGKGLFYGVIGVATLIVAIIGATFAYFTATATNNTVIVGTAATSGLTLTVSLVSTSATGPMVPQLEAGIASALGATSSCVDGTGNTVCKVYKISIENTGTSAVVVDGTLTLAANTGATFTNLKWSQLATATTEQASPVYNASSTTALVSGEALEPVVAPTGSGVDYAEYYVVVYIKETGSVQNETDTGSFIGTVTFNSAGGSGVTSTFTS